VVRTLITVLFPAPFGPRKEKISPFFTVKLMLSTAFTSPKKYSRLFTSMTSSSRTSTPFPLYLKRIRPSVINRFFAALIHLYIFPENGFKHNKTGFSLFSCLLENSIHPAECITLQVQSEFDRQEFDLSAPGFSAPGFEYIINFTLFLSQNLYS
jgi:hypothetical protein